MKVSAALKRFDNKLAIARAIGISHVAVYNWGEVVPLASAVALEIVTSGELRLDPALYPSLKIALGHVRAYQAAAKALGVRPVTGSA